MEYRVIEQASIATTVKDIMEKRFLSSICRGVELVEMHLTQRSAHIIIE